MARNERRYCAFDDQEVREIRQADNDALKVLGKGAPPEGFYHTNAGKIPNCGRQFLAEHQTYTEGESDLTPPGSEA